MRTQGTKWFITLSTRSESDVDEKVVHTLATGYFQHYVVKEYGKNHDHPHYHICIWSHKIESSDVIKRRWIKQLDLENQPHSIKVVLMTDEQRLIGQYLNKDSYAEVLISNLPQELITTMQEMHTKVQKSKLPKRKHITMSDAADEIIAFAMAHDQPLDSRQHMINVISQMYSEGYRMSSSWSRMKYLYLEIRAITGRTIDEQEIFSSF